MENFEYKNKRLELEESSNPKVSINGEQIQVSYDEDASNFNAGELPYQSFKSVKELAETIVDQRVQNELDGETP